MSSLKEEFNLFIFVREVANINKWKKIFDLSIQSEEELRHFYDKIKRVTELQDSNYGSFIKFINSTKVYQASYVKLFQKIEQIREDNVYDSGADYLEETENLVFQPEKLDSNCYLVKSFPESICLAELKSQVDLNSYWGNNSSKFHVPFKGILYSIREIPENLLSDYCEINSYRKINFCDIGLESTDKNSLISQLIRTQIIQKASEQGFRLFGKSLYKPHTDFDCAISKIKVENEKLRYLSRIYFKEDGSINFIVHRALKFRTMVLNGHFFVLFDNYRLFSTDGKNIITGEHAKRLNYKFPPTKAFNDPEKSKMYFLLKAIGLQISNSNILDFNQFNYKNQFTFERMIFEMPCKVESGEIFDENFDYEDNYYPKLTDYFEE